MHRPAHNTGSTPTHQQGAALLIFFVVLILAGSAFLLTHTPPETGRVQSENRTSEALATAKQALLAYAISRYSHIYASDPLLGLLPCPERSTGYNGDGNSSPNCGTRDTNSIGRLPWRHLQIPPPHDGAGECLWYALSGGFYNNPVSLMTNDDTPGMFELYDASGNLLAGNTPENRVVAVVIAPGAPLAGQNRSSAQNASLPCKQTGDLIDIDDYLDSFLGIDNTAVNDVTADQVDRFITATGLGDNPGLNDRIITISAAEIFDAIKARPPLYDEKIGELGVELGNCLIDYANLAYDASDDGGPGPGDPDPPCTLASCNNDCDAQRTLCLMTADSGQEIAACQRARRDCRRDCRDNCSGGPGGGPPGGPPGPPASDPYHRLPWPASVNLNNDYRLNSSYINTDSEGYLGRLPYNIASSSNEIGIGEPDLFTACELENSNREMFNLWQHWKDHWFYVLGSDLAPDQASAPAVVCQNNCPQVNGGARQAAILIFSGERINNQLRRTNETEDPDPPLAQSKGNLANYLEGSNLGNYQDGNGNGNYGVNNQNDRLFCINSAVNSVTECTP